MFASELLTFNSTMKIENEFSYIYIYIVRIVFVTFCKLDNLDSNNRHSYSDLMQKRPTKSKK